MTLPTPGPHAYGSVLNMKKKLKKIQKSSYLFPHILEKNLNSWARGSGPRKGLT